MLGIMWQYCQNLNDSNKAIAEWDPEWEGLISAKQIISVSFDQRHGAYLVVWKHEAGPWPCDPLKNRDCTKVNCYLRGGKCRLTDKQDCRREESE